MDKQAGPTPPPVVPIAYAPPVMLGPRKKSRWWLWLLIGGGVFGVVVFFVGGLALYYVFGTADIEPVAEAFQARLDAGDFEGAYQSVGPEFKADFTKEAFTGFESAVLRRLGKLQSKSMASFNLRERNNQGTGRLIYRCVFEKGRADVTYALSRSTGAWLVVGHRVDSPAIDQLLTCPKCGTVSSEWADFCPKCGAKLDH